MVGLRVHAVGWLPRLPAAATSPPASCLRRRRSCPSEARRAARMAVAGPSWFFSSLLLPSPFLLHSFPSFLLAPVAVGACLELVTDLRAWPPDPRRRSLDLLSAGGSTQIRWWAAGCGLRQRRRCAGPGRLQLEAYTRRLLCIGPGGGARRRWWRRPGAPCLTVWWRLAASSGGLCCPR